MAQISRLHRLIQGVMRGVDLTSNTLVVGDIQVGGLAGTILTKTILDRLVSLQNGSDVAATYHTHDGIYTRTTDLASTASGKGASLIGIEDASSQFTATTVEGALDEALDAAQAAKAESAALVTLSGRPTLSADLGTFTGDTIPDASTVKAALQSLESAIEGLPDPIVYKGTWDASTNTPTLANTDTGKTGWLYQVTVAGSVDFGAGSISFEPGDKVVNNGTSWDKWDMTDAVTSVNGKTGAAVLVTDDIAEDGSPINLWFTDLRARTAAVVDSTAGAETDQAASVSSMKSYVTTAIGGLSSELVQVLANAGESLSATTLIALRWGKPASTETAGRLYKADIDSTSADSFHVVALAYPASGLSAGQAVIGVKAGKLTATSHGLTVGEPVFLGASGVLTQTPSTTDLMAVVKVGMVRDANTIDVQIEIMGVN